MADETHPRHYLHVAADVDAEQEAQALWYAEKADEAGEPDHAALCRADAAVFGRWSGFQRSIAPDVPRVAN